MFVRVVPRQSSSSSPPPARLTKGAPVSSVGSFTQVASLQPSKETGPEEESLRYADTWDEFKSRSLSLKKLKSTKSGDPTHTLGELAVTPDVLALIISWRAQHDTTTSSAFSARRAASAYRAASEDTARTGDEKPSSAAESSLF